MRSIVTKKFNKKLIEIAVIVILPNIQTPLYSQAGAASCLMAAKPGVSSPDITYGCTEMADAFKTAALCAKLEQLRANSPLSRYIPSPKSCREMGFPGTGIQNQFGNTVTCSVTFHGSVAICPPLLTEEMSRLIGF
jgi:hypothetical protein